MVYTFSMDTQKYEMISLTVKKELKDKLKDLARSERRTQTVILERALENYFKAKKI